MHHTTGWQCHVKYQHTLAYLQCALIATDEYGFCDSDWHSVPRLKPNVLTCKSHSKPLDLSGHDFTCACSWHWAYTPFIRWQAPRVSQHNANRRILAEFVAWNPLIVIKRHCRVLPRLFIKGDVAKQIAAHIKFQTTNTQPRIQMQSSATVRKKTCSSSWQLPAESVFKHVHSCFELNGKQFLRDHKPVLLNAHTYRQLWYEFLWMSEGLFWHFHL